MVITRQILGLNKLIFGTGEVDFGSLQDELWDITIRVFLGQKKLIFGS